MVCDERGTFHKDTLKWLKQTKGSDDKTIFKYSAIQRIMTVIYKAFDVADEEEKHLSRFLDVNYKT